MKYYNQLRTYLQETDRDQDIHTLHQALIKYSCRIETLERVITFWEFTYVISIAVILLVVALVS